MRASDGLPDRFNAADWFIARHVREGRGEPARERVAAIRDRAEDRHAVAADGTRTTETAEPVTTEPVTEARVTREPVTREPVTEDPAVEDQNASRTAYPPR